MFQNPPTGGAPSGWLLPTGGYCHLQPRSILRASQTFQGTLTPNLYFSAYAFLLLCLQDAQHSNEVLLLTPGVPAAWPNAIPCVPTSGCHGHSWQELSGIKLPHFLHWLPGFLSCVPKYFHLIPPLSQYDGAVVSQGLP